MITWDDAQKLVERTLPLIRENFERDGHVHPVVFIVFTTNPQTGQVLPEPEVGVVPLPVSDEGTVTFPVEAIAEALERMASDAYVLVATIHGTCVDGRGTPTGDCRDMLVVVLEHRDGEHAYWEAEVIQKGVIRSLGAWDRPEQMRITSPLTGVFRRALKKLN